MLKVSILLLLIIGSVFTEESLTEEIIKQYKDKIDGMIKMINDDHDSILRFTSALDTDLNNLSDRVRTSGDFLNTRIDRFNQIATSVNTKIDTMNTKIAQLKTQQGDIDRESTALLVKSTTFNNITNEQREKMNRMYLTRGVTVHQDILQALKDGVIKKSGNPAGWDSTSYHSGNLWNRRTILNIGNPTSDMYQGISVVPPKGTQVIWLRNANHCWNHVNMSTSPQANYGNYASGYRNLNEISPDGGCPDTHWSTHKWMPMAIKNDSDGTTPFYISARANSCSWFSGIAFSGNLNNHVSLSAVSYHWAINGGEGLVWNSENWNNDILAEVTQGRIWKLRIPVVPNGKDKLFYLVEHNSNWQGTQHTTVKCGGKLIERFRTSYNNAFATHFNSKMYDRYIAAKIPGSLLTQFAEWIDCEIDMTNNDHRLYIREAGTHDL